MKIGMLTDIYTPHISGVTLYIQENRRILESFGHDVYIFTFGPVHPSDDERVLRTPGLSLGSNGVFLNNRYSRAAREMLPHMDIIHCHHPFLSGRMAIKYAKPHGIPIVFTNHTRYDLYLKTYLPFLPDRIGQQILKTTLSTFFGSIDAIIAPSTQIKRIVEQSWVKNTPIHVIPNGVDLTFINQSVDTKSREASGYTSDHFIFIYVGRLANEKNLLLLIKSFSMVAEKFPFVRLLLLGTGPQKTMLEKTVHEENLDHVVKFEGFVEHPLIPKYLRMSDAFVTASVTEVFPLSVIEAMGCGLPVVGIASPGISDLVEDGRTGYVGDNNKDSLTEMMLSLTGDKEKCRKMASKARELARNFDLALTGKQVEAVYMKLAENSIREEPSREMHAWFGGKQ